MCEFKGACQVPGGFWVQSNYEPLERSVTACSRHVAAAIINMNGLVMGDDTYRLRGFGWRGVVVKVNKEWAIRVFGREVWEVGAWEGGTRDGG